MSEERGFKRMSTFARTWTENIAFPRIVTEAFGLNNDSEEAWAKRLMQEYANLRKGNEGDVPGQYHSL